MRTPVVAGNWKMNGSRDSIGELLAGLKSQLESMTLEAEVLLCPPAIYIPQVLEAVAGTGLGVGGQNAAAQENGAFTGETSPSFLADFGCSHVILGHSERRQIFHETDSLIAEKFILAQAQNLTPILCVGETQQEREADETFNVVSRQLLAVIDAAGVNALGNAIVAYEPVWAIGTGLTATPEQAQDVHAAIRQLVAERDQSLADQLRILYGGSVKASNAQTLFSCKDIDGGLIGGASLDAEDFAAICQAANK
ncbi:MAG: triose-phosphate isomerase [Pseudomonadales bacterium]|nr:triose-phosphate isomerase [Pseudomonadales bacterium]